VHANECAVGEIECFRQPLILGQLPGSIDPRPQKLILMPLQISSIPRFGGWHLFPLAPFFLLP